MQSGRPAGSWLESRSVAMARVLTLASEVAPADTSVLLTGETGTGKEVLARHIHAASRRAQRTFLAVNCGALPLTLAESELFGHEKGAFSGATERRQGHFETADGGTLVLDEVSELALPLQTRLLRVLQEREVQRVGASRVVPVDVRIIATTNRDLRQMVARGDFRKDLFYRLNVFPLALPPLRERMEDVPDLAQSLIERLTRRGLGTREASLELTAMALGKLMRHVWPGNVRELGNVLERALVLSGGGPIQGEHIVLDQPFHLDAGEDGGEVVELRPRSLHDQERQSILEVLAACGGNRTHAARRLGISVRTLRNRLRDYRDEGLPVTPPGAGAAPVVASPTSLPRPFDGGRS